ncbi:MAG TPA: CFI-box-CTERM domain-containing protein [Armatimonadota bacterium]|nr:CFI-box-CTERM domain-containing protein [Armatimonadota bacterium]
MERRRFYAGLRITVLAMVVAFTAGALLTIDLPLAPPALAKGVARPKTEDGSSSKKDEPKKSEPKEESKPAQRREERQPSEGSGSAIGRREERRTDVSQEQEKPYYYRRDEGTPDVRGQVEKREERRDPDYRFRKHYIDRFFHPYDYEFHSCYPRYDSGVVIIIRQDTWDSSRHRWRRSYEYSHPLPGSLEEALVDIEATWWEKDPEFLMWHVDHLGDVDMYCEGKYSHTLTPRQIYKLTAEALERTETTEFRFTSVDHHGFSARAEARHEYIGPDGHVRVAYVTYYLEKVRNRWIIDRINIREPKYGLARCFIATAAYGTPMQEEVLVLREFRERYLLTSIPGRAIVATYYAVSPPIARAIEKSEIAKAAVRGMLKPAVQLCKLVVLSEAR